MEFIFELLFEVFLEGGVEISKNKKISKLIRYPILLIIVLLFSAAIFGLLALGIFMVNKSIIVGLLFITISLVILFTSISKAKLTYFKVKDKK